MTLIEFTESIRHYYLRVIIISVVFLFAGVYFVKNVLAKKPSKTIENGFLILISALYFLDIIASIPYCEGENLNNLTPLSNISPLMFALSFVCLFLNDKMRTKIFEIMVIFNFVMIIASLFYPIYGMITAINYFDFSLLDSLNHVAYFLFVYYLLKSGKIATYMPSFWKSVGYVYSIIAFAVILNIVFETSFFGLCFNENYRIYSFKIIPNMFANNALYLVGLFLVMLIGYFLTKLIKPNKKIDTN